MASKIEIESAAAVVSSFAEGADLEVRIDSEAHTVPDTAVVTLARDQERFVAALLNPAPLAPAMERAIVRHAALIEPS